MTGMSETLESLRMHTKLTERGNLIFLEFVGAAGADERTPRGRIFNPGHSIEVGWFVYLLAEKVNNEEMKNMALDVIEGSLKEGWDYDHFGGLLYMMDIQGKPMVD